MFYIKLKKLLNMSNIKIIDVRNNNEFSKFHLINSVNIPYIDLYHNYQLYLNKIDKYYIICETGYRSKKIAKYLRKKKYHVIYVKKGFKSK